MEVSKIMQHLIGLRYSEVIPRITSDSDGGDCCGWANVEYTDVPREIADELVEKNPALHDVVLIEYPSGEYDYDRRTVNFIFDLGDERAAVIGFDLSAGSGSGWAYGAYASLKYDGEEIANASY
jgi:hypothetical protein